MFVYGVFVWCVCIDVFVYGVFVWCVCMWCICMVCLYWCVCMRQLTNVFVSVSVRLHDSIQEESFHYLVFDL